MRPVHSCRFCGLAYEGRGIYADHGLAAYNLEQHEAACLDQQRRRAQIGMRKRMRQSRAYRKRLELAGGAAPMQSQLGFPFKGVPQVVD